METTDSDYETLPWVEKYRPTRLSEVVHHPNIIYSLRKLLQKGKLPHMLFYGASGTGKTSTILAVAKKLYNDNMNFMVLELNASDDRGINIVREEIKEFAESINMFKTGVKLIILDEADSMTFDAQFALRRVIEKYSYNTRFCLICNYINKIIPAIRSRCMQFRFSPIDELSVKEYVGKICDKEKVKITQDGYDSITNLTNGDLRKAINLLQSVNMAFPLVNEENSYYTMGVPSYSKIKEIVLFLISEKNFKQKFDYLNDLIKEHGYSIIDIINYVHKVLVTDQEILDEVNNIELAFILKHMSTLEHKLNISTFEEIYIGNFVSIFVLLKDTNFINDDFNDISQSINHS